MKKISKDIIRRSRNFVLLFTIIEILFAIAGKIIGTYSAKVMWFDIFQCNCMLFVLSIPYILRKEFKVKMPTELYYLVFTFAFCALILGDVKDFYKYIPWWDSMLHFMSGMIIPYFGLWLIQVLMAEKSEYIYMNKIFTSIFVIMMTMGLGAIWEIGEYTYDDLFGTNTQQFMATTTGSIVGQADQELSGHDALYDTMKDLKLALGGSLTIVAYANIKEKYAKDETEIVKEIQKATM